MVRSKPLARMKREREDFEISPESFPSRARARTAEEASIWGFCSRSFRISSFSPSAIARQVPLSLRVLGTSTSCPFALYAASHLRMQDSVILVFREDGIV